MMDDEIRAESLIKLVREHKKNCNTDDCGISLFSLREVYRRLVRRELTEDEVRAFC
jgi:hypothetical protein